MDDIEEFKRALGPAGDRYTDAELRQLRREVRAMAELLLDIHLDKKRRNREARGKKQRFDTSASNP